MNKNMGEMSITAYLSFAAHLATQVLNVDLGQSICVSSVAEVSIHNSEGSINEYSIS
jgi:hypothetical protein